MKSSVVKRSVVIGGHKTNVSLEEPFRTDLKTIAHGQHVTLSALLAQIDDTRGEQSIPGDPPACSSPLSPATKLPSSSGKVGKGILSSSPCVFSMMGPLGQSAKCVIGPDGSPLTIVDLPSSDTIRWVIRRKAQVVAAVRGSLLSLEEASSYLGKPPSSGMA